MCSLHRGENVPLLSLEEADSLSRKRRECLLYTEERVSRCLMERRQTPSLYREESACFLHKAESVPLLYVGEADYFSVQGKECLLYTSDRVSLCLSLIHI